jgi:hypothetical protein
MSPLLAFLIFLFVVEVGIYARFKQGCRADDRAWADCQRRLRGLGRRSSPLDFSFEPGAIWVVSDPSDVAVLASE